MFQMEYTIPKKLQKDYPKDGQYFFQICKNGSCEEVYKGGYQRYYGYQIKLWEDFKDLEIPKGMYDVQVYVERNDGYFIDFYLYEIQYTGSKAVLKRENSVHCGDRF